MWIYNKDSNSYYDVTDEKILNRLRKDNRFEVDVKIPAKNASPAENDLTGTLTVASEENLIVELEEESEAVTESGNYCFICNKDFKNNVGLKSHNRMKHGDK